MTVITFGLQLQVLGRTIVLYLKLNTIDRVRTVLPAPAGLAVFPQVQLIHPANQLLDIQLFIEQEAGLEIAFVFMLAAEPGAGEIG